MAPPIWLISSPGGTATTHSQNTLCHSPLSGSRTIPSPLHAPQFSSHIHCTGRMPPPVTTRLPSRASDEVLSRKSPCSTWCGTFIAFAIL